MNKWEIITTKIVIKVLSISRNTRTASCTSILVDEVSEDTVGMPSFASI